MGPGDHDELVERDGVLDAGRRCIESLRQGHGAVLCILGEPGLGKTSALGLIVHEAARAGFDVGSARGEEIESSIAFGLAREVIASIPGELERCGLGQASDRLGPSALFLEVLRRLERRPGPGLVLALDDLHWADPESLRLFSFLARRAPRLRIALIATLRPWPRNPAEVVRGLADGDYVDLQTLSPLSRAASAVLLAERGAVEIPDPAEARAWELCRGNPLLLEVLAPALDRDQHLTANEDKLSGSNIAKALLLSRFAGMDSDATDCARAAAALGIRFDPAVAVEVARLDPDRAEQALTALYLSGLCVPAEGAALRFAHPLFAEALYDDIRAPLRPRLHERAFRALLRRGEQAEAARHAARAELVAEPEACAVLASAGRAALATGEVAAALDSLEAAVRCAAGAPTPELIVALADALLRSGRTASAIATVEDLLDSPELEASQRYDALQLLGSALLLSGAVERARSTFEEAIELALDNGDRTSAGRSLLAQAHAEFTVLGPTAAVRPAERALELAGEDERLRERAQATWGALAVSGGDLAGLAATEFVRARLDHPGPSPLTAEEHALPWGTIEQFAQNAMAAERYRESERAFRAAATATPAAVVHVCTRVSAMAPLLIRTGRLQEVLDEVCRLDELVQKYARALCSAEISRAESLLWLGRFEEHDASYVRAQAGALGGWTDQMHLACLRGQRLLWKGDATAAAEAFRRAEGLASEAGAAQTPQLGWKPHAIDAYLGAGLLADAGALVELCERSVTRQPGVWPRIVVELGRGAVARVEGRDEDAERHLRAALALHDEVELPLLRIEALLALGSHLRRCGRRIDARPSLAEAQLLAERTGAAFLGETARRELSLAGGRRRRGPQDRDQLTVAERRVAALAAEGLANAEIARRLQLSINTVETHLRRVYSKLSIRSRRQLMRPGYDFEEVETVQVG